MATIKKKAQNGAKLTPAQIKAAGVRSAMVDSANAVNSPMAGWSKSGKTWQERKSAAPQRMREGKTSTPSYQEIKANKEAARNKAVKSVSTKYKCGGKVTKKKK